VTTIHDVVSTNQLVLRLKEEFLSAIKEQQELLHRFS